MQSINSFHFQLDRSRQGLISNCIALSDDVLEFCFGISDKIRGASNMSKIRKKE